MLVLWGTRKILSFSTPSSNHVDTLINVSLRTVDNTNPWKLQPICFTFQHLQEPNSGSKSIIRHKYKYGWNKSEKRQSRAQKTRICKEFYFFRSVFTFMSPPIEKHDSSPLHKTTSVLKGTKYLEREKKKKFNGWVWA